MIISPKSALIGVIFLMIGESMAWKIRDEWIFAMADGREPIIELALISLASVVSTSLDSAKY